jgi:hydroxypyruvate isomerase
MKYSLCIDPLFPEVDFYDRIPIAAELGFPAFEFWDPMGKDIPRIAKLAQRHHISIAICGLKDSWKVRISSLTELVLQQVKESIQIVQELGCPSLLAIAGDVDGKGDLQKKLTIDNLKRIADLATKAGITINLEALNSLVDHKGYYLDSSLLGFEMIKAVGCEHIKLLYDIYHMQIMEGNIIATVTQNINWIGHFHSAAVPGRHEHFLGENDYPNIVKAITTAGYDHYFGLEYWPTYDQRRSVKDVLTYLGS